MFSEEVEKKLAGIEDLCICIRIKKNFIYAYPFDADVALSGAKVVTRKGKTVHSVQIVDNNGNPFVTGLYAGTRHKWDIVGRKKSVYIDDYMDLYIPERYFDPQWKDKIKLTNEEWQKQFGRPHPNVEKKWDFDNYLTQSIEGSEE